MSTEKKRSWSPIRQDARSPHLFSSSLCCSLSAVHKKRIFCQRTYWTVKKKKANQKKKINENNLLANDFLLFLSFTKRSRKVFMWLQMNSFAVLKFLLILSTRKKSNIKGNKNEMRSEHYMCKSNERLESWLQQLQRTMSINSRFLWAVLDMALPRLIPWIFNCLFFSPLHYRIMTHKNKLEFCSESQSTFQRLINSLACLIVCTMSFGLLFSNFNSLKPRLGFFFLC